MTTKTFELLWTVSSIVLAAAGGYAFFRLLLYVGGHVEILAGWRP